MSNETSHLKKYREASGKTLEALGEKFGIDKSTMLRWEADGPPPRRVLDVERVTGVSRHDLRPDIFGPAPKKSERA